MTTREALAAFVETLLAQWDSGDGLLEVETNNWTLAEFLADRLVEWELGQQPSDAEIEAAAAEYHQATVSIIPPYAWAETDEVRRLVCRTIARSILVAARDVRLSAPEPKQTER